MDAELLPLPQPVPSRLDPLIVGRDLSPAEASRLCGDGVLVRCVGDVVVEPATLGDPGQRAACVLAALRHERIDPDLWVVAQQAALWVHAGGPPRSTWPALDTVVLLGPRGRSTRYRGTAVHRQGVPGADEIRRLDGLRLTTPARTGADLARLLPPQAAHAALDRLRAATGLGRRDVEAALAAQRGARGVATARRTVAGWAPGAVSGAVPPGPGPGELQVVAAAGDPVGVEHAVHLAHLRDDVAEMSRVGHLEREAADRHSVA